jgi:hypothetical protein
VLLAEGSFGQLLVRLRHKVSILYVVFTMAGSLCAANSSASALGNPIITPPSAMASKKTHANAGPDPLRAVHASKCFSSVNRHRPIDEKIFKIMLRFTSLSGDKGSGVTTVMPSRI